MGRVSTVRGCEKWWLRSDEVQPVLRRELILLLLLLMVVFVAAFTTPLVPLLIPALVSIPGLPLLALTPPPLLPLLWLLCLQR